MAILALFAADRLPFSLSLWGRPAQAEARNNGRLFNAREVIVQAVHTARPGQDVESNRAGPGTIEEEMPSRCCDELQCGEGGGTHQAGEIRQAGSQATHASDGARWSGTSAVPFPAEFSTFSRAHMSWESSRCA